MFIKLFTRLFGSELGPFLFFLVLFTLLVYVLRSFIRQVILALKLRGPKAIPLIGNCLILVDKNKMIDESKVAFEKYGPIPRIWITILPSFLLLEPEHIQTVLSSKKHTDKLFVYRFMHNFLGKGLITNSGDKWDRHRRLLQPSFHMSILEKFIESFADGADAFCRQIEKRNNVPTNVTEFVNDCIIDILNETVFGVSIKDKPVKVEKKKSLFRQSTIVLPYRLTKPWLMVDWLYDLTDTSAREGNQQSKVDTFTRKMIQERRKARQQGGIERQCLVDFMLGISEKHLEFTEDDIVQEANTFMLAGQDSVGASVAFTLALLARHKDIQEKCCQEINEIFQGNEERAPTMDDLGQMKYLEQCIKESLRLYPSVPLMARKIGEEVKVGDHVLPSGSLVLFSVYATHHLSHIYPDPERFDPERFSAENSKKRNPYAFLGFSAGPRICLGYRYALIEMKTILSRILRSFALDTVPGREQIKPGFRITLRAQGGLWMRFIKREKKVGEDYKSSISVAAVQ